MTTTLFGQSSQTTPRITSAIEDSKRTVLRGNTPPFAQAQYDRGALADSNAANRMLLVLKRSPAQEADFKQLISDLHNKKSASYHKWLTPEQFGKRFGPADSDVAAVNSWLQQHGFTINKTSQGKSVIDFSGTAGQVKSAFHTELHSYERNGIKFISNNQDPQIPTAMRSVVAGIASLNNVKPTSYQQVLGTATFNPKTHAVKPQWTYPADAGGVYLVLAPGDFAVQYDVNPVYKAGTTGGGETIGIISASNVDNSTVANYRTLFNLSNNVPSTIVDGNDPGSDGDDAGVEALLDVEVSGSVAPGAQVNLYVSADTTVTSGLYTAALRAVDDNVADVLSLSYGVCEQNIGSAGNLFFESLWSQAAAQGQTAFVSAGDGGSAGCDNFNAEAQATLGLAVNGFGSTPYNVSVGGTDFYYTSTSVITNYWDTTGTTAPATSLLQPAPEQPWNNAFGLNVGGPPNDGTIVGGGGGASSCVLGTEDPTTGEYTSCSAGYPKPSWQVGAGVPADGVRDVPDVSLFAANGLNFSFWPICYAATDCSPSYVDPNTGTEYITGIGGTSASSPAMAGVMALIDQAEKGRQGNANYVFYPLATQSPTAFKDVTVGSNNVPCVQGSPNCTLDTNGDGFYSLQEYSTTAGYDQASGLGSVDVANLISNWNSISFSTTTTSLNLSTTSFQHGTPVTATSQVTSGSGTPTGPIALVTTSTLPGQIGIGSATLANDGTVSSSISSLPGGTYALSAQYGGDGTFATSTSSPVTVNVSPESSALSLSGIYWSYDPVSSSLTKHPITDGIKATFGGYYYFDVQPYGASSSLAHPDGYPTGPVTITDNGTAVATVNLNSNGVAEWSTGTLGIGKHAIAASYSGDASFQTSKASPFTINVAQGVPTVFMDYYYLGLQLNGVIVAGQSFTVPVDIQAAGGESIGGTVTVRLGSQSQTVPVISANNYGSPQGVGTAVFPNVAAGSYALSAIYNGDTNFVETPASNPETVVAIANGLLPSTTTLTSSGTSVGPHGALTMNAAVTGTGGTPTGFVAILQNGGIITYVPLDSSGNASFQFTAAALYQTTGPSQITAQYTGDRSYNASFSQPITIDVTNGDFSLTTNNPVLPIKSGSTGSATISVGAVAGVTYAIGAGASSLSGAVALSCATSSPDLICTLSPASVTLPSDPSAQITSQVTINTHLDGSGTSTAKDARKGIALTAGAGIMVASLFLILPTRRRTSGKLFLLLLLFGAGAGAVSCGGGSNGGGTNPGTNAAPGNYTATLTATCSGITHTIVIKVVVQ